MTQPAVNAGAGEEDEDEEPFLPLCARGTNARALLTPTRWLRPLRHTATTALSLPSGFHHPLAAAVLLAADGRSAKKYFSPSLSPATNQPIDRLDSFI